MFLPSSVTFYESMDLKGTFLWCTREINFFLTCQGKLRVTKWTFRFMISVYLSSLLHLIMLGTTKLSFENDKEETCPKIGFHCLLKEISSSSVGLRQFVFDNTIYTQKEFFKFIIVIYFLLSTRSSVHSIHSLKSNITCHYRGGYMFTFTYQSWAMCENSISFLSDMKATCPSWYRW